MTRGITKRITIHEADEPVTEPYPGVPADKTADMESCVEKVMAGGEYDKEAAIKICMSSVMEGKDLDEAMRTFKLSMESPVSPSGETAPVAEAATVKSRIRAAMRAVEELLGSKEIPGELTESVKALRELFKTKAWADLATQKAGEPQAESEPQTSPNLIEHFAESFGGVVVSEADSALDPARAPLTMQVRLIRPGWGNAKDSHFYTPEVIKSAEKLFEGKKMYNTDHRQEEKNVASEWAKIEKVDHYEADGSPIATVKVINPDFAEIVRTRQAAGELATLECSVLGSGTAKAFEKDGRKGKLVESITDIESVDWVTKAGAGGQAQEVVAESDKNTTPEGAKETMTDKADPVKVEVEVKTPVADVVAPVAEAEQPAPAEVTRLSEAEVTALLEGEKRLPVASREKLAEVQYKDAEEVKAAYTKELAYLAKLQGSGQPFGLGAAQLATPKSYVERLAEANQKLDEYLKSRR